MTRRALLTALSLLPLGARARAGPDPAAAPGAPAASAAADPEAHGSFARDAAPVSSAEEVLDVMSFEPLARKALPPAHFGYIATGIDDDRTVAWNHEAYAHYRIRARRFADLSHIDTGCTVLGRRWRTPLYLSAVSSMRAFHPEAELAVARAARSRSVEMMLSSAGSTAIEPVRDARGAPLWQQLYATDDWKVTTGIVHRAEAAGCEAIVLTVDARGSRNRETLKRAMRIDTRVCNDCHAGNPQHEAWRRAPMFAGLDVTHVTRLVPLDLTPAYLDRLRALVRVPLIIKGIVTGEDATLALEHGANALIVSNHGGREEETLRATIDALSEVVAAVGGRAPVLLDGGIRRGTDVFKAIALGATAVGIGRPQAWGLAAFGQPGVEAVIDILDRELTDIMRQAATPTLREVTSDRIVRPPAF